MRGPPQIRSPRKFLTLKFVHTEPSAITCSLGFLLWCWFWNFLFLGFCFGKLYFLYPPVCLYNFGSSGLPWDLSPLMDPERVVDFSYCENVSDNFQGPYMPRSEVRFLWIENMPSCISLRIAISTSLFCSSILIHLEIGLEWLYFLMIMCYIVCVLYFIDFLVCWVLLGLYLGY